VDIGLEGKMLIAAFAAAAAAHATGSAWTGLAAGIVASTALALVHGFAAISQRGNQIVSGVAINMLAAGLTAIVGNAWYGQGGRTPPLEGDARFGDLLFGHSAPVFLAPRRSAHWWCWRGRARLRLRARRREPGRRDTPASPVRAPLRRRDRRRDPVRPRRHLSVRRPIRRASCPT
jgi:simple sugar transport system permease protein